jgi:branched-subunit amino acid transport protein
MSALWIAIVLGAVATYLTRAVPLLVTPRGTAPPPLRRYLDALPIAVIAALAGGGIALPDGAPTGGAEVVAAIVAVALARWRPNLLIAALGGVIGVALLRAAGL